MPLRAANARLRELIAERDELIAELRVQVAEAGELREHVIRHEPGCCGRCGAGLGGARVTGKERRQVTEIPPVKAEVAEHQMIERECPGCGARTKAQAPDWVNAPVQYGPRAAAMATYLWHGQFLSRDRAAAALGENLAARRPGRDRRDDGEGRRDHRAGDRCHRQGADRR